MGGFGWISPWGHEACAGRAAIGGGDACERRHWGLRWSSLWGRVSGVPKWVWWCHASAATGDDDDDGDDDGEEG